MHYNSSSKQKNQNSKFPPTCVCVCLLSVPVCGCFKNRLNSNLSVRLSSRFFGYLAGSQSSGTTSIGGSEMQTIIYCTIGHYSFRYVEKHINPKYSFVTIAELTVYGNNFYDYVIFVAIA